MTNVTLSVLKDKAFAAMFGKGVTRPMSYTSMGKKIRFYFLFFIFCVELFVLLYCDSNLYSICRSLTLHLFDCFVFCHPLLYDF